MKVAILESIVTPAGHEVEFDRILVDELNKQGHEPIMLVPENFPFKVQYQAPTSYLRGGEAVSYAGASRLKRLWLSVQREKRRISWFNSAYEKACQGEFDAIVVPTVSWRALRSIQKSKLTKSRVPVLLILHGIMPSDRERFVGLVRKLSQYTPIHIAALGLQTEFPELTNCKNFHTLRAPVYKPIDLPERPIFTLHDPIRLGFFGQYRKEKNLRFFLRAFTQTSFHTPVELLVHGATMTEEDTADFKELQEQYASYTNIKFLHKNLIGKEWQDALMSVDALLLPYGAERYRYQPSAMLFTAIGYYKPVLLSPEINPEVLQTFKIGNVVSMDSVEGFSTQLKEFIQDLSDNKEQFGDELEKANAYYGHDYLIGSIANILGGDCH